MKKIIFLALFGLTLMSIPLVALAQTVDYYRYYYGQKVTMKVVPNRYMLVYDAAVERSQVMPVTIQDAELLHSFEMSNKQYELFNAHTDQFVEMIRHLTGEFHVSPVFLNADGREQFASNEILVELREKNDLANIAAIEQEYNLIRIEDESTRWLGDLIKFRLVPPYNRSSLDIANKLYESGLVTFSDVNWVFDLEFHSVTPNDQYFSDQWNIIKTKTDYAWNITTGSDNVIIAIVDEGVDLYHEDLDVNLLRDGSGNIIGINTTNTGSSNDPHPYGNNAHGTASSGVASAMGNNSDGIAGASWNSKIMPIQIGREVSGDYNWTYNDWIINGINFAANNGAHIISNSWGGIDTVQSVQNAFSNAVSGGAVVIASSGNYYSYNSNQTEVRNPAAITSVIAVGATRQNDVRKALNDGSGEQWGSAFGAQLDLVAPGINIPTSDISNSAGYQSGDYEMNFNGTSSSAPLVSGVVALMLSVNSNLTPSQVRTILQNTADKVSGMSGQNFTNQYGYGRLNAYEAVKAALPVSSYGTYGSSQYSVHTLHWKEETLLGTTTITIPAGKALVVSDYVWASGPSSSKVVVHGTLILNEGAYWDATRFEIKSGGKMRLEGSNTLSSVDIEVDSGGLLDVYPGSTIRLTTNQNVLSYGKVLFDGVTVNKLSSNRWGALTLSGSGTAGSSIVNTTITGSTNGVRLINADDVHIDTSALNDHLNNGLYVYGSSAIRITATEMNSNGAHGLLSDFSSIYFDPYSSFSSNEDGIRADGGSWLTFGTTNEEAFATSIGNTNGVHALYYSYVELGGPSYGGGSTIRNNTSYNARAQDNSYIEAQYTWWGHTNPPGSMFNADGSSVIDRSNWLTHAAFKMIPTEVQPTESQNSDANRRAMAVQTIRRDMAASGTGIERWVDHTDADIREAATMIRLATSLQTQDFETATTLAGHLLERKDASPSERSAAHRALFLAEFMNGRPELASGHLSQSRTFGESDYLGYLSDLIESKGSDQVQTPIEEPSSLTASVYPNPFNPSAVIGFRLPVDNQTRLTVYDILGREVAILVNGILSAGQHQATFDGAGMASGIYMYRLQTGNQVITGKMMLMK